MKDQKKTRIQMIANNYNKFIGVSVCCVSMCGVKLTKDTRSVS